MSSSGGPTSGLTDVAGAGLSAGQSLVRAGSILLTIVQTLASLAIVLVGAVAIFIGMWMLTTYGPRWVSELEHTMRTDVYPLWKDTLSDWVSIARRLFNGLICWWNASVYWIVGLWRYVLFPTIRECGIKPVLTSVIEFVRVTAEDYVILIISGRFRTGLADFSRISPAGQAMFQAFIDLYTCTCSDLGDVLRTTPILSPVLFVMPPLSLFAQQWTYPETWCAIENAANTGILLLQQIFQLATQILNVLGGNTGPNFVFVRPNLRAAAIQLCAAIRCARRSIEKAMQLWWDRYLPFELKWDGFLELLDAAGCIVTRTFAWAFQVLVNIDQAVQYPGNPWWEREMKPETIIIINMWAKPTPFDAVRLPRAPISSPLRYTMTNYYLDQAEPSTPWGAANPLYQTPRLTEGVCVFLTRALCDPTDAGGVCFNGIANQLLMGFDFCCLTTKLGNGLADIATGLFEFSLHLAKGPDDFFLFIDAQPFTTVLRNDLIAFVRCAAKVFSLIPQFGVALENLAVAILAYIIAMIDFAIRVGIGLATLPYYILVLPDITNFLQTPNEALDFFVAIQDQLIADTPQSLRNSLCVLANNAFPIPPIPCSQCNVGGFIPPAPLAFTDKRRDFRFFDDAGNVLNTPLSLMREAWGLPPPEPNEGAYHITPLIYYGANHTSNPIELANMLYVSVSSLEVHKVMPWKRLRDVDEWVDKRKAKMMQTWRSRQQCNARAAELRHLEQTEPKRYRYLQRMGAFTNETCTQDKDLPLIVPWNARESRSVSYTGRAVTGPEGAEAGLRPGRLTTLPTAPPVYGCSPTPQCFDLCCILRALLNLAVHIVQTLARFFAGLIQHGAASQGTTQDFPYFTGEFANFGKPTFESDTVKLILLAFAPIKCVCEVLNLIIPVTPSAFTQGRPDLCCFVQRFGELVSCTYQVLVNMINGLAMGSSSNWSYFRNGFFIRDVETLLDIALEVVTCLGIFIRSIFPLSYIPGYSDATDFDPSCALEVLLDFAIEVTRFILQIIISLVTITINPDSFCYWRLDRTYDHNCGGKLDEIGVVKQWDRLNQVLLPKHTLGETGQFHSLPDGTLIWVADDNPTSSGGACYTTCGIDNGGNGIVPCICQILNTLIPYRRDPGRKVNCSPDPALKNCQELDLCCFFAKIGFFIMDFNHFAGRVVVGLWQSWASGLPEFAVNYFFCVEKRAAPCPQIQNPHPEPCQAMIDHPPIPVCTGTYPVVDPNTMMPTTRCGEFTCAKTNIIVADLTDPFQGLLARCTCEVLGLLDTLVALIFNLLATLPGLQYATWSCCLCGGYNGMTNGCSRRDVNPCAGDKFSPLSEGGGGSGVLPALSYIIGAITRASFRLMRQIPFSCYWHPSLSYGQQVPMNVAQTWIFSFGGPTADALCIAVGNMQCFANSMFFLPQYCLRYGERFLGGTVRWAAELIFRVIGFIEAFVETLIALPWSCIGDKCTASSGYSQPPVKGVNSRRLGDMLVILLSWPFDSLIGDAAVACTTICPSTFANPRPDSQLPDGTYKGCAAGALSCSCGCWNDSPNYANKKGKINNLPPYRWAGLAEGGTDPAGICRDLTPALVNAGIVQHVGLNYGRTDGCCVLYNLAFTSLPMALPVCQSPDDSDLYFGTNSDYSNVITHTPSGYPGSCTYLGACRPDALPSCANDAETPYGLAVNYVGALDGIAMAFMKYMRCLLDHTLSCQRPSAPCDTRLQFGVVFYPAILIFSLVWQLLGGLIRFLVAIAIFFFTLFTPPEGGPCQCWQNSWIDGYGDSSNGYYQIANEWFFGGFCYPCNANNVDCATPVRGLGIPPTLTIRNAFRCPDYCPIYHRLGNPAISALDAYDLCVAQYANWSPKFHPEYTAAEVCSGHVQHNFTVYEYYPGYPKAQASCTIPQCTPVKGTINSCITEANNGLCRPILGGGYCGGTDSARYLALDMCPDPWCLDPANYTIIDGQTVRGLWPCAGVFGNTVPANALFRCGVIQILNSALDVFRAFVAIFDQKWFVTPNQSRNLHNATFLDTIAYTIRTAQAYRDKSKRNSHEFRRESRQMWEKRMSGRYTGVIAGPTIDDPARPNFAEMMASALFSYDTSDCYSDPVTCACRNLNMPDHCYLDGNGTIVFPPSKKRQTQGPMTSAELTSMLSSEMFTGTSVCDHVIASAAGLEWNSSSVRMEEKHLWVNCLDKYIQGSRLNAVTDGVIPPDILYNSQAPVYVMHNLYTSAQQSIRDESASKLRARMEYQKKRNETEFRAEFHRKFPKWHEQLRNRTAETRLVLEREYGMNDGRLMFDAIIKADLYWFKYASGYYHFIVREAADVIASYEITTFLPTKEDALKEVKASFDDLRRMFWQQPYGELTVATWNAGSKLREAGQWIYDEGVHPWIKRQWETFDRHAQARGDPEKPARVALLKESIMASPLYRMWFGSPKSEEKRDASQGLFGPFMDHMSRVWAEYRSPDGVRNSINFWNADLHFWSLGDIFTRRWQNPRWTPENLEAWDQMRRLVHRFQHWVAPDSLTEEQKRFLYDSNCKLIDRTVNLTMQVVDYCANEYVVNLARTEGTNRAIHGGWMSDLADRSLHGGDHLYHGWRRRAHFSYELMPGSAEQNDPYAWRRPRLNLTSAGAAYYEARQLRARYTQIDHRAYRRAVVIPRQGPAGVDVYDQIVMWVESVLSFAFSAQSDSWFDDFRAWVLNPNTDISAYPDVGLKYWLRFPFVCHFPENLNCSIGMGMERALLWTAIVFAGVALVSAYIFSLIDLPFRFLGYGLAVLIIFPAMAWHYSPMCWFPPPLSALPMCLGDEIWGFLNKWITNCYVPLILPAYMVAGETCPADPNQFINVVSCAQVGVRDGLQNILLLGWWLFGQTFVDVVKAGTTIVFSAFFPGVQRYFTVTLDSFVNAGPTDQERQVFCFWATLPAIVTPIIGVLLVIVFGIAIVMAALALLEAFITLFMAAPTGAIVTGPENSPYFQPPEDAFPDGGADKINPMPAPPPQPTSIQADAGWLTQWMFGGPPTRRAPPSTPAGWTKKNQ